MELKTKEALSTGKLLGFWFSIFGLFAGFLYPAGSEEREKFILGWKGGFISALIIVITIGFVVFLFRGLR